MYKKIENLAQLKRSLTRGTAFEISWPGRPMQNRIVDVVRSVGIISVNPDSGDVGITLNYGKAEEWDFTGDVCTWYRCGDRAREVLSIRVLEGVNRLAELEEILAADAVRREEEAAAEEAERLAEIEAENEQANKVLDTAIEKLLAGKCVDNDDITIDGKETKVVLALAERYGVKIPLRTRGWITQRLARVVVYADGNVQYWYTGKKGNTSSVICEYVQRIYDLAKSAAEEPEEPAEEACIDAFLSGEDPADATITDTTDGNKEVNTMTSINNIREYLSAKITGWYANAGIDYDVSGRFLDVQEDGNDLRIIWEEDGKRYACVVAWWRDYSGAEQIYNIWMEEDEPEELPAVDAATATNNKEETQMKTGDIVRITGAYFKNDNGLYVVTRSPGDPSWSGDYYSLTKVGVSGKLSTAKYNLGSWPIMVMVSGGAKAAEAKAWNAAHAEIHPAAVKDMSGVIDYFRAQAEECREMVEHYSPYWGAGSIDIANYRSAQEFYEAVVSDLTGEAAVNEADDWDVDPAAIRAKLKSGEASAFADQVMRDVELIAAEQEREETLRQRNEGREYIQRIAAEHPITDGEPVVTVQWSEHPAFSTWRDSELKLSATAAEIVLTHFNEEREGDERGGYDKTGFEIADENGDVVYTGRYDIGAESGGLVEHIRHYTGRTPFSAEEERAGRLALADQLEAFLAGGQPKEPKTPAGGGCTRRIDGVYTPVRGGYAQRLDSCSTMFIPTMCVASYDAETGTVYGHAPDYEAMEAAKKPAVKADAPGEYVYTYELEHAPIGCDYKADLSCYGEHYFLYPLRDGLPQLKGRGVRYDKRNGSYKVTRRAYDKIKAEYRIQYELCLD